MKTPTFNSVAEIKSYFVNVDIVNEFGSICSARTNKQTVQNMLYENESVIKGGFVYYFAFKHIGLNVYTIKLRPKGKVDCYIVEQFEKHEIFEGPAGCLATARY